MHISSFAYYGQITRNKQGKKTTKRKKKNGIVKRSKKFWLWKVHNNAIHINTSVSGTRKNMWPHPAWPLVSNVSFGMGNLGWRMKKKKHRTKVMRKPICSTEKPHQHQKIFMLEFYAAFSANNQIAGECQRFKKSISWICPASSHIYQFIFDECQWNIFVSIFQWVFFFRQTVTCENPRMRMEIWCVWCANIGVSRVAFS